MGWVSIVKYPLLLVLGFTIQLLSYLLSTLLFLASPVIYIGHVVLYLALLPLRILIKLEAFIYFMTGAVLVGATLGMMLHFTGSTLSQVLHIEESDEPRRPRVKQELLDSEPQKPSFDYLEAQTEDRKFLPYSTILEEEENSHESG
ncbi:hypothetical protein N7489_003181 [Penicillium chrysogenum]|uniref:Uncharacterized protein n=1 Tax=Penicillium chrysogenum TaxID=5076 RepID=A0ABQ8W7T6_PENCH|nr:uncharacterized protein N7489_003181 [Penicillium chrysogenum]KAJ5252771.1 hypothetical protein N7489_003181 [Penicillium chrysogenum]KAJ5254077.1 hypothetical protein N7524_011257 [Penicillium chrysogenum]KAJ5260005.1 hypothetical protein N7505_009386 [Penicillium chrysogenum]KAJ6142080.1 hypothetical protein N7497_011179 [Penicillium chrysogenum]